MQNIMSAIRTAVQDDPHTSRWFSLSDRINTFLSFRIDLHELIEAAPEGHPLASLWTAFCDLDTARCDVREARKSLMLRGPDKCGLRVSDAEKCLSDAKADLVHACQNVLRAC